MKIAPEIGGEANKNNNKKYQIFTKLTKNRIVIIRTKIAQFIINFNIINILIQQQVSIVINYRYNRVKI